MKNKLLAGALIVLALVLVLVITRGCTSKNSEMVRAGEAQAGTIFSCPMHPQIRQPNPGSCPLCGMDLVAIASDGEAADDANLPVLSVSPRAAALMQIQTAVVERRAVQAERRFLGKFVYDETRLHDIVVRTEGQLQRLFVNYTGIPVRQGEHIAEIYSPEFYTAARDLLVTGSVGDDPASVEAAKLKLRLLDVSEDQIEAIQKTNQPPQNFTLYSPVTGVLTELGGRQGTWLMKGQRVAQIADISSLWVLLDAYESDIALIQYGQQVQLDTPAFPGHSSTGFVAYVAPDLDERTRTIKVRLNVPNPDGRLRPGMFAHALLQVPLTASGLAYGPELAGKFICPMHPEITGTGPVACSICDMPLEAAKSIENVNADVNVILPLVIPATAPLLTGKRAVVYVQIPDGDRPTFEGRTVTLGPRAGENYLVLDGVKEGELVVTHGNFKIDSELQIRGRPSMMAPASQPGIEPFHDHTDVESPTHELRVDVPPAFGDKINELVGPYLELVNALAADDLENSRAAVTALRDQLEHVDSDSLEPDAAQAWQLVSNSLHSALQTALDSAGIDTLRQQLVAITRDFERAVVSFGAGQVDALYRAHCPMAFGNQGADWLQADQAIANPYFGAKMLTCGEIRGQLP